MMGGDKWLRSPESCALSNMAIYDDDAVDALTTFVLNIFVVRKAGSEVQTPFGIAIEGTEEGQRDRITVATAVMCSVAGPAERAVPPHSYGEDVCRKKWKGLRYTYLKERRKELEKRSGAAAGAAKKWRFSAVLSFLNPFVAPRPTTSNMGQVEEMAEDLPAPPPEENTSETEDTNDDDTEERSTPSEAPAASSASDSACSSSAAAQPPEPSEAERALLEALQNRPPPPPPPRVYSSMEHFILVFFEGIPDTLASVEVLLGYPTQTMQWKLYRRWPPHRGSTTSVRTSTTRRPTSKCEVRMPKESSTTRRAREAVILKNHSSGDRRPRDMPRQPPKTWGVGTSLLSSRRGGQGADGCASPQSLTQSRVGQNAAVTRSDHKTPKIDDTEPHIPRPQLQEDN
ncbi:hypothetical protein CRENBAI_012927 [Crenichthys baileyi]|uniref:MADF domain-containing protein n=1 Tax=Crenichthys baileyi TaxID=28760 RepID=A0AAV9R289_9TELE